jgi:hypothetical protein
MLTPEVTRAIDELRASFPGCELSIREDAQGGASVIVEDAPLGTPYQQETTWLGAVISFQYPYADVYPHFVRGDLTRMDGKPLGEATQPANFETRVAIQLSRRSNRLGEAPQTAAQKYLKVLDWLRRRP